MIKIIYPPGCYGNYLNKCIYWYSNLREEHFEPFIFDKHGSSHDHRTNQKAKTKVDCGHYGLLPLHKEDFIISLLPSVDHCLDYHNNSFYKFENGDLIKYLTHSFPKDIITDTLKTYWDYRGELDVNTPKWILREWCSFWLVDSWADGFNRNQYSLGDMNLEVNDIIYDIIGVLTKIFEKTGLKFSVDKTIINQTHKKFLLVQKFHNSQKNCNQWVDAIVNANTNLNLTMNSLYDEAYVQYLLKTLGFEMQCHGLDALPNSSLAMKTIIYKKDETSITNNQR